MALQSKNIRAATSEEQLYYRIEGIDFTISGQAIVYVNGYTLSDIESERRCVDSHVYTMPKAKDEPISYEAVYVWLKTLWEFQGAIDC